MSDSRAKKAMEYANKYNAENYDSLRIVIPKGHKATVQAAAEREGESINGYTNKALLARMGLKEWPDNTSVANEEEKIP